MNQKKIIMALFFLTFSIQATACPITTQDKIAGGQCIDLNRTEFYINISGKQHPTVLFISGLGADTTSWKHVTPAVSQFARVITYDRAGVGKSSICTSCKTSSAQDNVMMLHELLKKVSVSPPYILVGHSIGGLYAQLFAEMYPKEITGVVLVDSSSRNEVIFDHSVPKTAGFYKEAAAFDQSREQVKKAGPFPAIPLIILTATNHSRHESKEALWQQWQREFLQLSPQSFQMIALGSGHFIQRDQPQLVIDAIATLIKHQQD